MERQSDLWIIAPITTNKIEDVLNTFFLNWDHTAGNLDCWGWISICSRAVRPSICLSRLSVMSVCPVCQICHVCLDLWQVRKVIKVALSASFQLGNITSSRVQFDRHRYVVRAPTGTSADKISFSRRTSLFVRNSASFNVDAHLRRAMTTWS